MYRPEVVFEFPVFPQIGGSHPFDVTPDGRFIMIRTGETDVAVAPRLVLVENWFEELKSLVPRK